MDYAGFSPAVVTAGGRPDPAAIGEFFAGGYGQHFAGTGLRCRWSQ
jgi:hypothetical protein